MSRPRRLAPAGVFRQDPVLHTFLALLIIVPAYAVLWRSEGEGVDLVLYRQPKEAAVAILGWLFLTVFFWRRRDAAAVDGFTSLDIATRPLRHPEIRILVVLLGWMTLTLLWVRVPANALVELRLYLPLFLLLLVLVGWQERQPAIARVLRLALVVGFAGLTIVGLLQLVWEIPWLRPIDPEIGAVNPSFMGYKNPMALALLGQVFLLAEMATARRGNDSWPGGPWPWRLLLTAELMYLATLGSRTSLFALAVGAGYLVGLGWLSKTRRKSSDPPVIGLRRSAWIFGVLGVFAMVLTLHPVGRAKTSSVLEYLAHPSQYLQSDRGIYLRNTLEMVHHNPLGVGLGDWQTHYSVYRLHGRNVAFDNRHQVRRAHSDPVQLLGEGGWPGLALGLALFVWLIVTTGRDGWHGDRSALFLSAQVVALAVAMSTDYMLDLPYGKLQVFLLLALVIGRARPDPEVPEGSDHSPDPKPHLRWMARSITAVCFVALLLSTVFHARLLRRTVAAAAIQQGYRQWVVHGITALPLLAQRLEEHGPVFLASSAVTKTSHRDFLVLAHSAALLGHRAEAIDWARRTLELHPYYSPAYELMAHLADDPAVAETWREAQRYILDEARHGFEHPQPPPIVGPVPGSG